MLVGQFMNKREKLCFFNLNTEVWINCAFYPRCWLTCLFCWFPLSSVDSFMKGIKQVSSKLWIRVRQTFLLLRWWISWLLKIKAEITQIGAKLRTKVLCWLKFLLYPMSSKKWPLCMSESLISALYMEWRTEPIVGFCGKKSKFADGKKEKQRRRRVHNGQSSTYRRLRGHQQYDAK